jgi:hypothetical protein
VSLNIPYEAYSISDAKLDAGARKPVRNIEKINIMIVLSFLTTLFTDDKYLLNPPATTTYKNLKIVLSCYGKNLIL